MANVNKITSNKDDSEIDYVVWGDTSDYQRKCLQSRYYCAALHGMPARPYRGDYVKVLDAPCGSGVGTAWLQEQYPGARVTGVDLCEAAIQYAKENYRDVLYIHGDVREKISINEWDLVLSLEFLEHVPMKFCEDWVPLIHRYLAPGGRAVFSSPRLRPRESTKKRPGHINEMSEQQFYYLIEETFPYVERYSMDRYANVVEYTPDANLMIAVGHRMPKTNILTER